MNNAVLRTQFGAFERLQGGLRTSDPHANRSKAGIDWSANLSDVAQKHPVTSENTEAKRSQAQTLGLHADGCAALVKPRRQSRRTTSRWYTRRLNCAVCRGICQATCRATCRAMCRQARRGSNHGGDPK
jgi:hypothetical protein